MSLYLVRHGATDYNNNDLIQGGDIDIPLNIIGTLQAKMAAEQLRVTPISAIISTPLLRTIQTAKKINHYHRLQIKLVNDFKDRFFGNWNGRDSCCLNKLQPNLWDFNRNIKFEDIEPVQDFYFRIERALTKIHEQFQNQDICIVAHKGTILMVRAILYGIPSNGDLLNTGISVPNGKIEFFR